MTEVYLVKLGTGELWADSGCVRGVAGRKAHQELQTMLDRYGLRPLKVYRKDEFQFGSGDCAVAQYSYMYPTALDGKYTGNIIEALVEVDCPALFSKQMLKSWGAIVDFGKDTLHFKKHDVTVEYVKTMSK